MRVSVSDLTYTIEKIAGWADNAEAFLEIDGTRHKIGRIEFDGARLVIHADAPGHRFQGVSFLTQGAVAQGDGDPGVSEETQP